jgi:hypothetical protein
MIARIFLIVTIIAALGCIAIGLFVIKPAREKLEADLKTANETAASEKKQKEDAVGQMDKAKKELSSTKADLATAQSNLEKNKAELADREKKIQEVQSSLESASKELEEKKADLQKIQESLPAGVPIDQVAGKFKEFQDNLTTLDQEKKVLSEQLAKLTSEKKKLEEYIQNKKEGVMPMGLTGHILAINKDWNFVVLDIGQQQGVVEKVPMMVHRGGNLIGKVMVTSVEPSIAIADVMPEWKKEDFQEGDLVSF